MNFKSKIYRSMITEGQNILLEKQEYYDMFNDVIKLYGVCKQIFDETIAGDDPEDMNMFLDMFGQNTNLRLDRAIKMDIDKVKKGAKRSVNGEGDPKPAPDMAIWCLRYIKIVEFYRVISLANQILTFVEHDEEGGEKIINLATRVRNVAVETLNKYIYKITKLNPKFGEYLIENEEDEDEFMVQDRNLEKIHTWINNKLLGHFTGMVFVAGIQNYRFQNQWFDEINETFIEAEKAWQKEQEATKQYVPMDQMQGAEKLIEFPDGKMWLNLNRPYCDAEGRALGHCGNRPGHKADDIVLSFRSQVSTNGKKMMKPHLTFILHGDGTLGERKARGNQKPRADYHPYIVALLKLPIIKKIGNGIYLPVNDFQLGDLSPELTVDLMSARPDLYGMTPDQAKAEVQKIQSAQNQKPLGEGRVVVRRKR